MKNYDEIPGIVSCLGNMKEMKQRIEENSTDGVIERLLSQQPTSFQEAYKDFMKQVEAEVKERKPEVKQDKETVNMYKATIQSMIADMIHKKNIDKAGKMTFQNVGSITYKYENKQSVSLSKDKRTEMVEYFVDMGMLDLLDIDEASYIKLNESLVQSGNESLQGIVTEEKIDVKIVQS